MDKITKAVTKGGLIRIYAVNSKETVEKARELHQTSPLASAALGRLMTGGLLIGGMQKEDNVDITLQMRGGGPLGIVLAVADSHGTVRGYIENPQVELPLNSRGKLDVGGGIGREGYLSVVRDMKLKEPYVGQVPLQTGEVGDDLAFYFAQSEQIPSLVALGVLIDRDRTVKQAGGFIVQIMPDCDEFSLKKFEKAAEGITSVTAMLERGMSNKEIIREVMKDFEVDILGESEVCYQCRCSEERMRRAIVSLGKSEIQSIIEEQGEAEIVCQFCDKAYTFGKEELLKMLEEAKG